MACQLDWTLPHCPQAINDHHSHDECRAGDLLMTYRVAVPPNRIAIRARIRTGCMMRRSETGLSAGLDPPLLSPGLGRRVPNNL